MEVKIYFTPFSYNIPGMLLDPELTFICWGFNLFHFVKWREGVSLCCSGWPQPNEFKQSSCLSFSSTDFCVKLYTVNHRKVSFLHGTECVECLLCSRASLGTWNTMETVDTNLHGIHPYLQGTKSTWTSLQWKPASSLDSFGQTWKSTHHRSSFASLVMALCSRQMTCKEFS